MSELPHIIMNILDLNLDDAFRSCFITGGAPVIECQCGREHVAVDSTAFDYDADVIKQFKERAKTDDKVILHYEIDYIGSIEIDGKYFAEECECEGWKPYMNFILCHRKAIKYFLVQVAESAQTALEQEKTFGILKNIEL